MRELVIYLAVLAALFAAAGVSFYLRRYWRK